MKLKKNRETEKQALDALTEGMQELDDETMHQVSGAGNPFGDVPRVPTKPIDDDLRGNG